MTSAGSTFYPRVRGLASVLLLLATVLYALTSARVPRPRGADAPADVFSAARAKEHLDVLAARPRRICSAPHEEARAYIASAMEKLGFTVETEEANVLQLRYQKPSEGEPARVATVKNVVTRLRGTAGSPRAVLLMAHYDTRSMTPGAADDGAGTAALLEAARALTAGPRPKNDTIVLYTDGEEEGLLGAKAFVSHHPWAKDVAVVVNFDARGDTGPVFMFQTSRGGAPLVRALARAAPDPDATSLARAVYERMPNDTDLTVWLTARPDVAAMNFANVGGFERYHAPTDTVANLDLATLQQDGESALAMARRFGDAELPLEGGGEATYFDAGPFFVRYPEAWARPLAGVATAAYIALFAWLLARSKVKLGAFALGVACTVATLGVAAGGAALVMPLFLGARGADAALLHVARPALKGLYVEGFAAAAVALVALGWSMLGRRVGAAALAMGAGLVWAALAVAAAWLLPAGAYLVTWPSIGATAAWTALALTSGFDAGGPRAIIIAWAAALPGIVLALPLASQLVEVFGPAGAPAVAAVIVLVAGLAAPLALHVVALTPRLLPLATAILAVMLFVAAARAPAFDRDFPRPDTLFFTADADRKEALWATPDPTPDAFTSHVLTSPERDSLPAFFPLSPDAPLLVEDARYDTLLSAPPSAVVLSDAPEGTARRLVVRILPPGQAELLAFYTEKGPRVTSALVAGLSVPALPDGRLAVYDSAPPARGIDVVLTLEPSGPVTLRLVAQESGLPFGAGVRPEGFMKKPGSLPPWDEMKESDMTLLSRSVTF